MLEFIFLLIFIFSISVSIILFLFVALGLWGDFLGAPFVPTSSKIIKEILEKADLKKGKNFLELGSGDGRVTRMAAQKYGVKGLGIEIHPMLILYSNLLSKIQKLNGIKFQRANFFDIDFKKADVIFMFLLPKVLSKLKEKIQKECKNNTLIISHGFKIEGFEKYLIDKIDRKTFPTYYYKIQS